MKSSQAKKEFEQKLETLRTEVQPALTLSNISHCMAVDIAPFLYCKLI